MAKYLSNRVRTFDIGITSITESDVVLNVIGNTTFAGNVSLGDDERLRLGDAQDLQIYHDSTFNNSIIRESGSGNLVFGGDNILFRDAAVSELHARFITNGSVELYYDNAKKLETTTTGATTTGIHVADGFDAGDDERIRLGDSQDLQIYHDSTFNNGVIQESGSGNLLLAGQNINFRDANLGDTYALFRDDSTNTSVELYYNDTKKFETSTTGVTVTGTLTADGVDLGDDDRLRFGDSQDLQIYHDGSNSYINESGVGDLYIRGSNIVHLQTAGGQDGIKVITNGAVELYYGNTKRFETTSTGATTTGIHVADGFDLGDDEKLRLGDGNDLGSDNHSYIKESGAGNLKFMFVVKNADDSKISMLANPDGSVELYENNFKKFETTTTGADVTGSLRASTSLVTTTDGTGITITNNAIQGPATLTIDPAAVGDNTGTVVIAGDLQIDGTTTTVNSTTMTVDDKNLELGTGAANDAAADGGGITVVSGDGNKTFQFEATGDNLGSSENLNLANTKEYKINNTSVLSATTLGSGVTASSLTSVGTLTSLSVSGDLSIADKIVHTGDTDTAIRFPLDDTFTVETAGSERLRITSDGKVGIGTDNPNRKLVVQDSGNTFLSVKAGTSDDVGVIFGDTDNDARGLVRYANSDDSLRLWTAGSERFRIGSSGQIGLGGANYGTSGQVLTSNGALLVLLHGKIHLYLLQMNLLILLVSHYLLLTLQEQ